MPGFFSTIKTFGFFVAIAFLVAAWLLKKELQLKEKTGLLRPEFVPLKKARRYIPKEERGMSALENIAVFPHQRVGDIVIIAFGCWIDRS